MSQREWEPSLSSPSRQRCNVYPIRHSYFHVCTTTHTRTNIHINHKRKIARKLAKKTHSLLLGFPFLEKEERQGNPPPSLPSRGSQLLLPCRCLYMAANLVFFELYERTTTPRWPPKPSSGTRRKLVRISLVINSNLGPSINIQVKTEQSLLK